MLEASFHFVNQASQSTFLKVWQNSCASFQLKYYVGSCVGSFISLCELCISVNYVECLVSMSCISSLNIMLKVWCGVSCSPSWKQDKLLPKDDFLFFLIFLWMVITFSFLHHLLQISYIKLPYKHTIRGIHFLMFSRFLFDYMLVHVCRCAFTS